MTWTQPVCPGCWAVLHPDCAPARLARADEETCCICGDPTVSGIYVRINPATVEFPTERK